MAENGLVGPPFFMEALVDAYAVIVPDLRMTWPFVSNPVFRDLIPIADPIFSCPIVTPENRDAWEAFSGSTIFRVEDGIPRAQTLQEDGPQFFCPVFDGNGALVEDINLDLMSSPDVANAVMNNGTLLEGTVRVQNTGFEIYDEAFSASSELSWQIHPIFDDSDESYSVLVGLVVGFMPTETLEDLVYDGIELLGPIRRTMISYSAIRNETLPFSFNQLFSPLAAKVFESTPATIERVMYCPLVSIESRAAWEAFSSHFFTVSTGDEISSVSFSPTIQRLNESGQLVEEEQKSLYCPLWQHFPLQTTVSVNFNLMSLIEFNPVLVAQIDSFDSLDFKANDDFPFGPGLDIRVFPVSDDTAVKGLFIELRSDSSTATSTTAPSAHPVTVSPVDSTIQPTNEPSLSPSTPSPSVSPTQTPSIFPTQTPSSGSSTDSPADTIMTNLSGFDNASFSSIPSTSPSVAPVAVPSSAARITHSIEALFAYSLILVFPYMARWAER